jgi:chromosomal replication initiation ATPase DnaA
LALIATGLDAGSALYAAHPREPRVLGDDAFLARVVALAQPVEPRLSLDDIAVEVCLEMQLEPAEVRCPSQRRKLSRARGLIAARALEARAASLSEIARWLDRDISSVSRAAQRYG